jgi:hypothetical protein
MQVAIAAGSDDFLVVYTRQDDDESVLSARHIALSQPPGPEVIVSRGGDAQLEPDAVRTTTGWLLGWNRIGEGAQPELRSRRLLPDGGLDTDTGGDERSLGAPGTRSAAFAAVNHRVFMAYAEATETGVALRHRVLDADGVSVTEPQTLNAGQESGGVERIESAAGSSGAYVAWANASRHLFGRRIGASSAPLDAVATLSDPSPDPTGVFRFAHSGVAFGLVSGVEQMNFRTGRIRTISEEGTVNLQSRVINEGSAQVTAYGLSRFAAGFALIYRSASLGRNGVHVALLDSNMDEAFETTLFSVLDGEGAVLLKQAQDGRLMLVWLDRTLEGQTLLRSAILQCAA